MAIDLVPETALDELTGNRDVEGEGFWKEWNDDSEQPGVHEHPVAEQV